MCNKVGDKEGNKEGNKSMIVALPETEDNISIYKLMIVYGSDHRLL